MLAVKDVAKILTCSKVHVYSLIKMGKIKCINLSSKNGTAKKQMYRIHEEELNRFMASRAYNV